MNVNPLEYFQLDSQGKAIINCEIREQVQKDLVEYETFRKCLLSVTFLTISDYLFLLKGITVAMQSIGSRAMCYLAAAVSDFYLPESRVSDHKIPSEAGGLLLHLEPVPKLIRPLVCDWMPAGLVISFKLETDETLLEARALEALDRYRHDVVVANTLSTRREHLIIYDRIHETISRHEIIHAGTGEIEEQLIYYLTQLHDQYIQK